MSVILYHYSNSVCAEKARLALAEKQVEWEGRHVHLFKGEQFDPEYMKLNPKAVVPTLVHDGQVLVESTLICEYIDDAFPGPALKPADPMARAQMRIFTKMVDEGLHFGVGVFSFVAMFADRLRNMSDDERAAHFAAMPDLDRRERQSTIVEKGTEAPHVLKSISIWENGLAKIEKNLSDGRPWIMGEQYTLADLCLTPYMSRMEYIRYFEFFTEKRPNTREWWERVKARPSFTTANRSWFEQEELDEMSEGGLRTKDVIAAKRKHFLETDLVAAPKAA